MQKQMQKNVEELQQIFNNSEDLITKAFSISNKKCSLMYMDGLVDSNEISASVLIPAKRTESLPQKQVLQYITENVLLVPDVAEETEISKVVESISQGKTVVLIDGQDTVLLLGLEKLKERTVSEPPTSAVMKGPRGGFVENIKTNVAFLRKIIASPDLITEYMTVGQYSKTQVCVMYINGIAKKSVVEKIINKIKDIKIDGVLDSSYILQFLEEYPNSFLKQVASAEKPDIIAGKILEGRVAIFVDGSPLVLTLPFIVMEDFQHSDDYYNKPAIATLLRILRVFGLVVTVLLPGLYISIQLYHYKAIPLKFLITITNATQGLPLTPFAEILFVLILFELLYEASLKMPKYLGLALSIVGALVLGDTAVKSGIISSPAVMIVAISGITLYTLPEQSSQLIILRLLCTIAGGLLGFYGVVLVTVFLVVYMNDFDSYEIAYLAPIAPLVKNDHQDTLFKKHLTDMKKRPKSIPHNNKKRIKDGKKTDG